jgi:parvulin-like peptidyl-prolyl isomerase
MTVPATAGELIDAVAATVDREVILQSDLVAEIGPLLETLRTSAATQQEFDRQVDEALRDALDQAVEQKILYREALLAGVEVTDEDIDDRLRQIKAQYESNDAFMRVVEQAGESMGDFRERLRKQIMAITMGVGKRRMFEDEAVISESEMAQYYQDNIDQFSRPERVKVRRIFLPASGDDLARAEAQLQALKEEISLGADFAGLAEAHSKGPSAEEGGLIGWVQRGDLVPQLEEVIFQMSAGDVSPVVLTDFGAQLLLVEEKQEAGQASFEEVRTEIEPILREQYADERYEKWMNELRKRSRVNIYL